MADKGFDIQDILAEKQIVLNIPPLTYVGNCQLTASETIITIRIASLRIRVERAIKHVKAYHILDTEFPL